MTHERKKSLTWSWFESHFPGSFDWLLWHFCKAQKARKFMKISQTLGQVLWGLPPRICETLGYENAPLGLPQGPRTCRKVGAHPERRVKLVLKFVGICWNAPSISVGETNIRPTSRSASNSCASWIFAGVNSYETILLWILLQLVDLSATDSSEFWLLKWGIDLSRTGFLPIKYICYFHNSTILGAYNLLVLYMRVCNYTPLMHQR